MTHVEFVEAYRAGRVRVAVDRSLANRLMDTEFVPKSYFTIQSAWMFAGVMPLGLGGFFAAWYQWWPGLLLAAFGVAMLILKGRMECALVTRRALADEGFYRLVMEQQILELRDV